MGKAEKIHKTPVVIPSDKLKAADFVVASLEKKYGKGAIMKLGSRVGIKHPCIPTGIYQLDRGVIQAGGFPRGRVVEVFGPESCLDSDTFVQFEVRSKSGARRNHKGGTIRRLYERFHGTNKHHLENGESVFYVPSLNEEGRIFQNRVVDVVKTGYKLCFDVVTKQGYSIKATAEHKFFNGEAYCSLSSLQEGSTVIIHNNTPFSMDEYIKRQERKYLYVKAHGVSGIKCIEGGKYKYHRLLRSRAVVEALLNDMSFDEYVGVLNSGHIEGLNFLPRTAHVHHIDEDVTNDSVGNLVVIDASGHGRIHAIERHNNLRYEGIKDEVASIKYVGGRETYDIRVLSPFNNYVANNFVVHNSGKTTLTLQVIAQAQKGGDLAAFIDAEHALDPSWASTLGVDVDNLHVSQPDSGEQALETAEELVRSGAFGIVVVDSVAALVPQAEIDGEMGDSHVGLQARLMSQALRKLTGVVSKSNTSLVFINQLREKIGVMFGSPETTAGGRALKFYATLRLDVRRIATIKDGEISVGNNTKIKAVKNKVGAPFRECETDLLFGVGFNTVGSVIDAGVFNGAVEKAGSWFSFKGERLGQGRNQTCAALRDDDKLFDKIYAAVVKADEEADAA